MSDKYKRIELTANVAIIALAVILGYALISKYFAGTEPVREPAAGPVLGTEIGLDGVEWANAEKHLILGFSKTCRFCLESMEFYSQLSSKKEGRENIRFIVVSEQPVAEISEIFNANNIKVDQYVQAGLAGLNINATPTLVLVGSDGSVQGKWVGRLRPEAEAELFAALFGG